MIVIWQMKDVFLIKNWIILITCLKAIILSKIIYYKKDKIIDIMIISLSLFFNYFKVKISNDHTNIISSKLKIRKITNFRGILFISVILFPSGFTFIHKCNSCSLFVFMLFNKPTYLSWRHNIPTTIRTNYNVFICFLKL